MTGLGFKADPVLVRTLPSALALSLVCFLFRLMFRQDRCAQLGSQPQISVN